MLRKLTTLLGKLIKNKDMYRNSEETDTKYKVVVKCHYSENFLDMLYWVNNNSNNAVNVDFENTYGGEAVYIRFENLDDALLFKIKYGDQICR